MAKAKQKSKLQKRDWSIIGIIIAIMATNWFWYQAHQAQEISHRTATEAWLQHQVQINELKACIDKNIEPCEIAPQQYYNSLKFE